MPLPRRLTRRSIPAARPPYWLAARLQAAGVHALDACAAEGWRTPPGRSAPGASVLACEPEIVFRGGLEALASARQWLAQWRSSEPFAALLIGYLSYDLGRAFERIPERIPPEPLDRRCPLAPVCLAGFRALYRYDPARRSGAVLGSDPGAVARLAARIESSAAAVEAPRSARLPAPMPRTPDAKFLAGVRRIQEWIRAGHVYQVNLSRRLDASIAPSSLPALYAQLTHASGAPCSAFLDTGDAIVLSNSPERFLRVEGRRVETCPIKGTRPRGRSREEDALLAKALCNSEKDLAEHLMIVDLERNDLGRVSRTGSVQVGRLQKLRSFGAVHHLVSSVVAELEDPADWTRLLAATFPGGSVTGAPKLRAMEIIEELEPVRRGVYTGAIGCFDAAGGIDLSLAIRTAVARGRTIHLHLGSGIVADSDPHAELSETSDKGRAFAALWSGTA